MPKKPSDSVLDPHDRRVLTDRAVSVPTAVRNRPRTTDGELVFPFRTLDGAVNCYAVRRPHSPTVRDGRPLKYLRPADQPARTSRTSACPPSGTQPPRCSSPRDRSRRWP